MKKQTHFGEWGVMVQCSSSDIDVHWYKTKKEALTEYRDKKKECVLTFLVRQVNVR